MTVLRSQSVPAGAKEHWVSAIGSGGYHYRRCHNDNWTARREESLSRVQQQIEDEKNYRKGFDILSHDYRDYKQKPAVPGVTVQKLPYQVTRLSPYDINRKISYSALGNQPMMEQPVESGSWLMNVNSRMCAYDIISNREQNPHFRAHTKSELESSLKQHGPLFGQESRKSREIDRHSMPAGAAAPPCVVTFTKGRNPPPIVGIDVRPQLDLK